MLDAFDLIRIISLRQRTDRRAEMRSELRKVGLNDDTRIAFFDAIRPADAGNFASIGAHGVYLSHVEVLREAVAKKSSVLILEDDCDLSERVADLTLPPDWQIFYGGYMAGDPGDLHRSDIVGAHMMGFSRNCAPLVLDYLTKLRVTVEHPPIDGAYVWFRRAHPAVKTVFAEPPVGYQRPSRSDITPGRFYNRIAGLRDMVQLVRRARRAVGAGRRAPLK